MTLEEFQSELSDLLARAQKNISIEDLIEELETQVEVLEDEADE